MRRAPRSSMSEHLRLILALQRSWASRSRASCWRPSRRARRPTRRRMPWPRSCRAMHGRGSARSASCPPAAAGPHGAAVRGRSGWLRPRPGGPGEGPGHAAEAPGAHGGAQAGPPAAPRPLTRDEPISFVRGSPRITAVRRIPASPSRPATRRDRTETLGRTASWRADERPRPAEASAPAVAFLTPRIHSSPKANDDKNIVPCCPIATNRSTCGRGEPAPAADSSLSGAGPLDGICSFSMT